jgi:GH35 family endo-1,4-beta-xylanase
MTAVRPNLRDFNFDGADTLVDWAEANGMKIRAIIVVVMSRPQPEWLNNYDFGSCPAPKPSGYCASMSPLFANTMETASLPGM